MQVNEMFPSKFLNAADLRGQAVNLIMAQTVREEVGGDKDLKPVLYFNGTEKGMVLNRTNADAIGQMYGNDTDGWVGKPLTIIPAQTDLRGKIVPCIRVQLATPNAVGAIPAVGAVLPTVQAPAPPGLPEAVGDLDSDIPFA